MTEINLLPWRELKREQEKKQFTSVLVIMVIVGVVVVLMLNYYANSLIDRQQARNQRLQHEIQTFDRQISEIKKLKELREAFVSRMMVVQNLQAARPHTVHLFDELIKVMPDGVHVNKVERNGNNVTILGNAISNTHVSDMMRNIEKNKWIQQPILTEIKKTRDSDDSEANEFRLSFILQPQLQTIKNE